MLQHNWVMDHGWMSPFAKYWGPGRRAPGLMYTRHRMSQRSTDTSDRIHYSLLQCYYLPMNVRCLRDSLSVTDSGSHSRIPFEAPFVDFLRDKIYTEFSPATSQRKLEISHVAQLRWLIVSLTYFGSLIQR